MPPLETFAHRLARQVQTLNYNLCYPTSTLVEYKCKYSTINVNGSKSADWQLGTYLSKSPRDNSCTISYHTRIKRMLRLASAFMTCPPGINRHDFANSNISTFFERRRNKPTRCTVNPNNEITGYDVSQFLSSTIPTCHNSSTFANMKRHFCIGTDYYVVSSRVWPCKRSSKVKWSLTKRILLDSWETRTT